MGDLHLIFMAALCLLVLNADASVVTNSSVTKWLFKRQVRGCSGAEYFLCKSGECLVKYSLCDSVVDCADRSDEAAAVCQALYKGRCQSNQWRCTYGACLKESQRCDQKVDCWDGSDEENCPLGPSSSKLPLSQECNCKEKEERKTHKKYVVDNQKKLNWFEASMYCQVQNKRLAIVTTEEENNKVVAAIEEAFPELPRSSHTAFWVGGTDIGREGVWSWFATGRPIGNYQFPGYSNWEPTQPDNLGGKEHCLQYWKYSEVINWNDDICHNEKFFVCEYFE